MVSPYRHTQRTEVKRDTATITDAFPCLLYAAIVAQRNTRIQVHPLVVEIRKPHRRHHLEVPVFLRIPLAIILFLSTHPHRIHLHTDAQPVVDAILILRKQVRRIKLIAVNGLRLAIIIP